MGKGEIACHEQFLLFHSVFKRFDSQGCQKVSLCGNGLTLSDMKNIKSLPNIKSSQKTLSNLMKMAECSKKG